MASVRIPVSGFRVVGRQVETVAPGTLDEVIALMRSPEFVWLDFDLEKAPRDEVQELLEKRLDFHPLTVEECITPDVYQPKMEEERGYKFFILHYFRETSSDYYKASEVNLYLGPGFVLTLHRKPIPEFVELFRRNLPEDLFGFSDKAIIFFYHVLDVLIDDYLRMLVAIEHRGDAIEFKILPSKDLPVPTQSQPRRWGDRQAVMREIVSQRHNLILMRRSIIEELKIIGEMTAQYEEPEGPLPLPEGEREEIVLYLGGLTNHLLQAQQIVEHEREILTQVLDVHSMVLGTQTNEIFRVLTIIATIFIPLTFITGFYGMNLQNLHGGSFGWFIWVLDGIMLAVAGGMLWWFRRKDWV